MTYKKTLIGIFVLTNSMIISLTASAVPVVILDNTGSTREPGVTTNLPTSDGAGCPLANVMARTCNSFDVNQDQFQVINRTPDNSIEGLVGVTNPNVGSFNNRGTNRALDLFDGDNELFDLDRLRRAADSLSGPIPPINTIPSPPRTTGSITWAEFVANAAVGRQMNGIVRVKVPLMFNQVNGKPQPGLCPKRAARLGAQNAQNAVDLQTICGCAPGVDTVLGDNEECGIKFEPNANINVRGSLFIDWVTCDANQTPVTLANLRRAPARTLNIQVNVPININPAPADPLKNVANLRNIANLSCAGARCDTVISAPIPFALVPRSSLDSFRADTGINLDATIFSQLNRAEQYHLLLPSGYVDGWQEAFTRLGMTTTAWKNLGFRIDDSKGTTITNDIIRSDRFEDLPALIYTGGLVQITNNVNISGLLYIPQFMEMQNNAMNGTQYVSGAVIVRDAFHISGNPANNGITYYANDPNTYSKIRLTTDQPRPPTPYKAPAAGSIESEGNIDRGPQWTEIHPRAK